MLFWNARRKLIPIIAAFGLLSGPVLAQGTEKVIDRFETGNNTYVLSLLHDKAGNSLWVGTSVGAMEIDLKTAAPRKTFTRKALPEAGTLHRRAGSRPGWQSGGRRC